MRSKEFRKTEAILSNYKYNKARYEAEHEYLDSIEPILSNRSDYAQPRPTNKRVTDPTAELALRLANQRSVLAMKLQRDYTELQKVEKVLRLLDPLERRFVELRYFNNLNDYRVIMKLDNMSSATYYRMKGEVIERFSLVLFGDPEN